VKPYLSKKQVNAIFGRKARVKRKHGGRSVSLLPTMIPSIMPSPPPQHTEPKLKWMVTTKHAYSNQTEFKIEGQLHFMSNLIKIREHPEVGELWIPIDDIEAIVKLPT
jgi:hypothetical protein